jgi:hypothetical protein
MVDLTEADWKCLQKLKSIFLERLCERINQKTLGILSDPSKTAYERYLAIFEKTRRDDRDVARAFDDWRRSRLGTIILELDRQGLFTESDLQSLGPEIEEYIALCQPPKKSRR